MDFNHYQDIAKSTDQFDTDPVRIVHHLLNLTESVGEISRFLEQELRAENFPPAYRTARLTRYLGDILWYITILASRNEIKLDEVASSNLQLTQERWASLKTFRGKAFDEKFPPMEKLPSRLRVAIYHPDPDARPKKVLICIPTEDNQWMQIGDRIDDNAAKDDGYRFHDILHLAHMALLGWSPVTRALLKRKRKTDPEIDRVEDGARAINIEEALTALVFSHAREVNFFEDVNQVDFNLLKIIARITKDLEVRHRSYQDWECSIVCGYTALRKAKLLQDVIVKIDTSKSYSERISVETLDEGTRMALSRAPISISPPDESDAGKHS